MLKAPAFWSHTKTPAQHLLKTALSPLGCVYGYAVQKRLDWHHPKPLSRPVICVGNLTLGGSGKTPVTLSLCSFLQERGYKPHILLRGYGSREHGPLKVDMNQHDADAVGDEALLLSQAAPTWIARGRPQGAQAAIASGAELVVMDDGFQNPTIYKDFSLLVIDGGMGFGNGGIFPSGFLRENIRSGLARADGAVLIGADTAGIKETLHAHAPELPLFHAHIVPDISRNPDIQEKSVYAFAGIGRPEKFKNTLGACGAQVTKWRSFPDHYRYKRDDLQDFVHQAQKEDALILTTTKDHVRLPEDLQKMIRTFHVTLSWTILTALYPACRINSKTENTAMPPTLDERGVPYTKRIVYVVEAACVHVVYFLLKTLPLTWSSALCGKVMEWIGPLTKGEKIARQNLALALPDADHDKIIKGMWNNVGRIIGEYPHLARLGPRIKVTGHKHIITTRDTEKPAMFVGAHIGNWEIKAVGAKKYDLPVALVYRSPNNPWIEGLLRRSRSLGNTGHIPKGREGARDILQQIKSGGAVGILMDQKLNEGLCVPFFGHPAMTTTAVAQFALKRDCPIYLIRIERRAGVHFQMTVYDPLPVIKTGNIEQDTLNIIQDIHKQFEIWIRETPEQWLWSHKRWLHSNYD